MSFTSTKRPPVITTCRSPLQLALPTAPRTPTTAPATDNMPEWAAWDRLFLDSIKPMASLFDESYNEAFKIYAAVTVFMGIAREINTADKTQKHMGMGKDGRLPGVFTWIKARVGVHKLTIFDRSPKNVRALSDILESGTATLFRAQ